MLEWKGLHGFSNEICLKALSWNCQVNHLHCILKSEQIYLNTSPDPVEAVYTFALPRGAVVTNFAIDIGGKLLQAQVAKTQQAADRYEKAIEDGDLPAMIEYCKDGLCTLNIGRIKPNEKVVISITCEWIQERVGDTVRFTIPTVIADRYSRDGSQGDLLPHQYVESSAFAEYPIKAHFEFVGREYENARFAAPGFSPVCTFNNGSVAIDIDHGFADRDLVVTAENVNAVAYSYLLDDDGQYRGIVVLPVPKLSDEVCNRELSLSLVVDCSGSMVGAAIQEARRALNSLPELLTERDKLTLTLFGSEQQVVFKKSQACTKTFFRRDFIPKVTQIDANLGGTEMTAALKEATKYTTGPTDVLLMTDGEIWETDECIELAKNRGQRVFVIGIGNAANGQFCHSIAEATGGAVEMVLPTEDMTAVMARMIQRMRRPSLQVKSFAPMHSQYRSHLLHQVHSDETLVVYFRFAKLPGQIPMLDLGDGNRQIRVEGAPWRLSDNRGLLMIAANTELADGVVDEPEDFAVRYSLLSEWTNLILVNEREIGRKTLAQPKLQRVPQMMNIAPCVRVGHGFYGLGVQQSYDMDPSCLYDLQEEENTKAAEGLPSDFWQCSRRQMASGVGFEDKRDCDRLDQLAVELDTPLEKIYFHYLLWLEEIKHEPLLQDLAEFKDLPELSLTEEKKRELWNKFSQVFLKGNSSKTLV